MNTLKQHREKIFLTLWGAILFIIIVERDISALL